MRRSFWKAVFVSVGAYAVAILAGFWADFRLALFLTLALQLTWTLFCVIRVIQFRLGDRSDREGYAFALGGAVSSILLLAGVVVFTQIV